MECGEGSEPWTIFRFDEEKKSLTDYVLRYIVKVSIISRLWLYK